MGAHEAAVLQPVKLMRPVKTAAGHWSVEAVQARLRALEEGLPVIRSTPTGISAVIDADGRLLQSLAHHSAGHIDSVLPGAHAPTPFAHWGNLLSLALAGLLLLLAVALAAFRR